MSQVGWITFHRWAFDAPHALGGIAFRTPAGATAWHAGPDSPIGPDGNRTGIGRSWAGAGFFVDRAGAETFLDGVETHFVDLPAHAEAFHCLLRPIRFAGDCRWLAPAGARIAPAAEDPGGPAVVLTSAGYDDTGPAQADRMRDFRENVDRVRDWYATLPGVLRQGAFATGTDGMTFTLWRSDADLNAAAYGRGVHRTNLDRQRVERMADRTSYTRTRLLRHRGTWAGRDPLAGPS